MRNIVIVASPRTGSTLLMLSLEQHPCAVSGSEWFNGRLQEIATEAWQRKRDGVPCNLFKVFGHEQDCEGFDELLAGACTVHLWREDREAQMASWRRACETGQWTARHRPGAFPMEFPPLAAQWADQGDAMLDRCELSYSYEALISTWDQCVLEILLTAGWPPMRLDQVLSKQG